ncbi:sugar transferase [Runella slithyformis]|uniref:Sugar transferase n=1 Tax=Runella slithyformis (strain ATCC 29530 / DSM 19594 / LMG 11500 / NCIMB 11436 / LSU 4) TaxID=761193 RepID=A0A7U4E7E1_RUNSL|nr:sugar transferase [Runella slithyformis]AEI50289.1 sugar transferase [Runella slithyformis DSM 19594]
MEDKLYPRSIEFRSNKASIHSISSKNSSGKEVLIITGYDYFLQKRDLKTILQKYCKLILIPRSVDIYYLETEVGKLIEQYEHIHMVNNPGYDQQHQIIYRFFALSNKTFRTTVVFDFCESFLKKIYIPESMSDAGEVHFDFKYFGLPIRIIKKSIDLGIGLFLLPPTLPFWAISAMYIRLQSPGKIFFRQKRVGIRNGEFSCIKFRSMHSDAESGGAQFASRNDERIFPFGRLMRATRIDELPQLLNIIKGEMSLVGPRPERRVFVDTFEELIPHYKQRHAVKPGISGYAQVMYPYGAGVTDARHKLMYDLYYIKHWSIGLEIQIIIRTIATVLLKRGL